MIEEEEKEEEKWLLFAYFGYFRAKREYFSYWQSFQTTSWFEGKEIYPGPSLLSFFLSFFLSPSISLRQTICACCIVLYRNIGPMSRVFANGLGDRGSIPGRVIAKTQKWYLMPPCLALSTIRWGSRVMWSNPGSGVAPSLTPRCSSYWKGSIRFNLD